MGTTGIAELVLCVADVVGTAVFYRDVVGLTPLTEATAEWAWFWTGAPDASARLALRHGSLLFEEHSPLPQGQRFGCVHYAFEVTNDALQPLLERLRQHQIPIYGPTHFDWMRATSHYFYDPEGNLLEYWTPD